MNNLVYALISAFAISLLSFVGVASLAISHEKFKKMLIYLVSFSAGGLLGSAFWHLLPEVIETETDLNLIFIFVLVGFCIFFILEKFLRWHHCHQKECEHSQHLGYMNLVGDSFHNLIDGLIIVAAFMASPSLGWVVTLSIILHEIPQELGDFAVLVYSGFTRKKALLLNFLTGLIALIGVVLGYFLINHVAGLNNFLIPAAAGGFIYIAASDLIPELHKETKGSSSILTFVVFLVALAFMLLSKIYFE